MLPALTVQAQGQGVFNAADMNSRIMWATNVGNLRAFTGLGGMTVWLQGFAVPDDDGQGMFFYDPASTAPDDGGVTTIKPTGVTGPGAWIRQPITPSSIPAGSITLPQIEDIPADTLLGNDTSGSGPVLALSVSQVLTLLGLSGGGGGASGGVAPTGSILLWPTSSAPTGWLICDGSAVSRTTYANLNTVASGVGYAAPFGPGDSSSTFNVPDFRGYFPRGWDSSGATDPGRTFGTTQTDAFQGHRHALGFTYIAGAANVFAETTIGSGALTGALLDPITDGANGAPRTADETRPINVAISFIIRT